MFFEMQSNEGQKREEVGNKSEQDKIGFTELYITFFRFNLSFSIAELHRFLWSLFAGVHPVTGSVGAGFHCSTYQNCFGKKE